MPIKEKVLGIFGSRNRTTRSDETLEELKQKIAQYLCASNAKRNKGTISFELEADMIQGFRSFSVPIYVKISYKKAGTIGNHDFFDGNVIIKLKGETFEKSLGDRVYFDLENQIAHTILKILRQDVGLPL